MVCLFAEIGLSTLKMLFIISNKLFYFFNALVFLISFSAINFFLLVIVILIQPLFPCCNFISSCFCFFLLFFYFCFSIHRLTDLEIIDSISSFFFSLLDSTWSWLLDRRIVLSICSLISNLLSE